MKGTEITLEARITVLERDSFDGCPCCIYCGKPLRKGGHLHHVERRSQGGQGGEENLVLLCFSCHTKLHNGHSEIQDYCRAYLKDRYGE